MTAKAQNRQSLFFRDLASPISSSHRASRFATSGHSAAAAPVSALWHENFATSDTPPPPPVFTLEDRIDFSPEPALLTSPGSAPEIPKTPTSSRNYVSTTPSPIRTNGTAERTPGSGSWWAPQRGEVEEAEEKGKGSPVDGVVTSSRALVMLPPLKEVAKVEMRNQLVARDGMMMDEEEWVTVYGFSSGDTNLVLREFEKCGVILKHVPGPRDANWMHILYQNRYDAQKALGKNGMQLNSALIVGVKPVDSVQRQYLKEKLNNTPGGFMTSLPPQLTPGRSSAISSRPNYEKNTTVVVKDNRPRSTGAIASPEKSVLSKVMDLMFGF